MLRQIYRTHDSDLQFMLLINAAKQPPKLLKKTIYTWYVAKVGHSLWEHFLKAAEIEKLKWRKQFHDVPRTAFDLENAKKTQWQAENYQVTPRLQSPVSNSSQDYNYHQQLNFGQNELVFFFFFAKIDARKILRQRQ